MKFTTIITDPHFNNLAAIIRWPFRSHDWKKRHTAEVPFWLLIEALDKANAQPFNKERWLVALSELLVAITKADPWLSYTTEDLEWMVEQLDGPYGATVASMFMASFSAPDEMLTPAEIAEATGTAESSWRNKAAAHQIPGATKKGKQWLLPRSVVMSQLSPEQAEALRQIKHALEDDSEDTGE